MVLPLWAVHEHANASAREDAVLFSIHGTPVLSALGLFDEEAYSEHGGHQPATSVFQVSNQGL